MRHEGSQFPNQGSNLHPLPWKCKVLTTGLPGKSLELHLFHIPGIRDGKRAVVELSITSPLDGSLGEFEKLFGTAL